MAWNIIPTEEQARKIHMREDKRMATAKSPLTWAEFRKAAIENGFVICKSSDPLGYKVAGYKTLVWFNPAKGKAVPFEVGTFFEGYKSNPPQASIITNIRMKAKLYRPHQVKEVGTEWFYDYDQCNKAFAKLAKKLNRIAEHPSEY